MNSIQQEALAKRRDLIAKAQELGFLGDLRAPGIQLQAWIMSHDGVPTKRSRRTIYQVAKQLGYPKSWTRATRADMVAYLMDYQFNIPIIATPTPVEYVDNATKSEIENLIRLEMKQDEPDQAKLTHLTRQLLLHLGNTTIATTNPETSKSDTTNKTNQPAPQPIQKKKQKKKKKKKKKKKVKIPCPPPSNHDQPTIFIRQQIDSRIDKMAAGHALRLSFPLHYDYTMSDLHTKTQSITRTVLSTLLSQFKFSVKLYLSGDLVNTETGERITDYPTYYPIRAYKHVHSQAQLDLYLQEFATYVQQFQSREEIYPSTKYKYDVVTGIGFHVSKQYTGGCTNHKNNTQYKRVLKNPDNKDNFCFWRCLVMALFNNIKILKKDSREQRTRAHTLLKHTQQLLQATFDLSSDGTVALSQIPGIAKALQLDIQVWTLKPKSQEATCLYKDESLIGNPGAHTLQSSYSQPIRLHYQGFKKKKKVTPPVTTTTSPTTLTGHYILINTLVGYGSVLKCSICNKSFNIKKNRARDYQTHLRKCALNGQSHIQQLRFKQGPVPKKQSLSAKYLPVPFQQDFWLAYDFECLLRKQHQVIGSDTYIQQHIPITVVCKSWSNQPTAPSLSFTYTGLDVGEKFIQWLEAQHIVIAEWKRKQFYKHVEPDVLKLKFPNCCESDIKMHTGYCHPLLRNQTIIVGQAITVDAANKPCNCHCTPRTQHISKCKYLAALRGLQQEHSAIPIVGFNSGKYDMTFVLNNMDKSTTLPIGNTIKSGSGYMHVQWGSYRFIDAHNFVPPNVSLSKFATMWKVQGIQKELFPYDWFDSIEKLQSPCLPPYQQFASQLNPHAMPTREEYKKAVALFQQQGFITFQQYEEYYCERDVDLLIQGMNNYRALFWQTSQLEILSFVSLPQLAYTDLLKTYIKAPLHYIPNKQTFDIINKSVYGGNCQVFEKYAHHKDGLIFSIDENNLYGHSMSSLLPYGDMTIHDMHSTRCKQVLESFNRVSKDPVLHSYYSKRALHGDGAGQIPNDPYDFEGFVKCHLHFTPAQKQKMQHFPPLPQKRVIQASEFSPFMKTKQSLLQTQYNIVKTKSAKMVYDVEDKHEYCIYSVMLKFLLEHDMVTLDAVYECVEMRVGYVMKDYITHCTSQRQLAEDDIKTAQDTNNKELLIDGKARKSFWKLMANSSFGKTMQSDEKYGDTHLVRNIRQFYKATMGKVHTDSVIIHENLVEVRTRKNKPLIKSPKYLAAAILANSKMLMLDFIYNAMWTTYSQQDAKILYTDTDSVYVQIRNNPDIKTYAQFQQQFSPAHQELHFAEAGDLTVGKMKLEKVIQEAVFLKPKTYALVSTVGEQESHNKGVKIYQNQQQHLMNQYKRVLFQQEIVKCTNVNIRRTEKFGGLRMNTLKQTKIGLDFWEDKRFWLNNLASIPYGLYHKASGKTVQNRIMSNLHTRALLLFPYMTKRLLFMQSFGSTIVAFLSKLDKQFQSGMCWRNYGVDWELDHIIPVSFVRKPEFAAFTATQQAKVRAKIIHYTNIQPMLSALNASKNDAMTKQAQDMIKSLL
jgi:hypothetical protein